MIDKKALATFIESRLEGTDLYLVDLKVTPDNVISVEIDSDTSVDIDKCVALTREIEGEFSRDDEDYELEVGSSGLTSPFKVVRQYVKNIGHEVEVLSCDGKKYKGLLRNADADSFTIVSDEKVKPEGAKRQVIEKVERTFGYGDVKYTKYLLQF
jgi:ribosome maturation factor RimP